MHFLNENFWISNMWLNHVPYGLVDYKAALVQIMSLCQTGDKPLSESMLICCTDTYMRHPSSMSNGMYNSHADVIAWNYFRITDCLPWESIGERWFSHTKGLYYGAWVISVLPVGTTCWTNGRVTDGANIDGLVQVRCMSMANALAILESCTKYLCNDNLKGDHHISVQTCANLVFKVRRLYRQFELI